MTSKSGGLMNSLPIESIHWRERLKQRIGLEAGILRALIRWGMAESASDVCRGLEEHFGSTLESQIEKTVTRPVRHSAADRVFVRDLLREAYLRTREIPRRSVTQERLHDGLLTGFDELSHQILLCYEGFLSESSALDEKAA